MQVIRSLAQRWQAARDDHRVAVLMILSLLVGCLLLPFVVIRATRGEWGVATAELLTSVLALGCFFHVLMTGRLVIATYVMTLTGTVFSVWAATRLGEQGFFVAFPLMAVNFLLLSRPQAWALLAAIVVGVTIHSCSAQADFTICGKDA